MFNLVRKAFIKDYKNVNDKVVREKHGVVASIGGIIINLILFAIKLVIGIIAMSRSIISDALKPFLGMTTNDKDKAAKYGLTVAQVFQKGFTLNEKVIRFAMVKVAN